MALSLLTDDQQVIIWGMTLAIFVIVSLRAVEAFMFYVITASTVASFI